MITYIYVCGLDSLWNIDLVLYKRYASPRSTRVTRTC